MNEKYLEKLVPALSFIKIIYSEACNYSFSCDLDEKNDYYENKNRIVSESLNLK